MFDVGLPPRFQFRKENPVRVDEKSVLTPLPFNLSFSKISDWYQCPVKFWANYLTKEIKFQDTPQTLRGKAVHSALEKYGLTGEVDKILKPHELNLITKIRAVPNAVRLFEQEGAFGFTSIEFTEVYPMKKMWDKQPNGEKFFLTGMADVIMVTGETAVIIDHKTGKQKRNFHEPDKLKDNVKNGWLQLQLYAMYILLRYPGVNRVKCILNYLSDNVTVDKIYSRDELSALQQNAKWTCEHILADYTRVLRMQAGIKDKLNFEYARGFAKPSPLCDWCGYKDDCLRHRQTANAAQLIYDKNNPSNGVGLL